MLEGNLQESPGTPNDVFRAEKPWVCCKTSMFFQEKQALFYDDRFPNQSINVFPRKTGTIFLLIVDGHGKVPLSSVDDWRVYDLRMGLATFLKLEHWKTQDVVGDDRF